MTTETMTAPAPTHVVQVVGDGDEYRAECGCGWASEWCFTAAEADWEATWHRDDSARAAEGVDVKTAQTLLGHSEARLTLDVYAQAVTELGRAAADAMGTRFLSLPRDGRAMDTGPAGEPS